MNIGHLKNLVIVPVLKRLEMYSDAAVNLLLGTAIQESRGIYLKQLGGGPALGIYQMEPATHDSLWDNYLNRPNKKQIADRVRTLELPDWYPINEAREMEGNLYYATAMCRIHYWQFAEPLPNATDISGMAFYWKRYYNTVEGAGTTAEFIENWGKEVI